MSVRKLSNSLGSDLFQAMHLQQQNDIFLQTMIDSLASHVAILDVNGVILMVNRLWQRFGDLNGLTWEDYGVGRNYIDVCNATLGESRKDALAVANGIEEVSEGISKDFYWEYPCHSPEEHAWFTLRVSRLIMSDGTMRMVMVHENVTSVKQNENDLREVQRQLAEGREAERLRIAQELHDVPIQELMSAQIHLSQIAKNLDKQKSNENLKTARDSVGQTIQVLRTLCYNLRPPILEDFGLAAAIEAYVDQLRRRKPELTILLSLPSETRLLPEWMELGLLRIVQQSLDNAAQHGEADEVKIILAVTETHIELKIDDNGKGFEVPERLVGLARQGHLGIVGSMERAEEIGGTFNIRSTIGQGTQVQVEVPLLTD